MGRRNKSVKNARDVERALRKGGCPIRQAGGSHRVGTLPDGRKITYPDHGEYGKGMSCKLSKLLIGAGLLAVLFGCYALWYGGMP